MLELLDRRLIFVTGKGGVGKSTVATALGLLGARHGKRTIVAELASQERVQRTFERAGETFEEVELTEGLYTISIDPQSAMEEYLRVKTGAVGQALGSSRLFGAFAMATPGMRELLSVGKVWELAQAQRRTEDADVYDLVIVDAPAAGHGAAILRTPQTFAVIARVGPIAHQAGVIATTIADRSFTSVVAVATPAEMPVNETLWLRDALAQDGRPIDLTIANACYPQRFGDDEAARLTAARETFGPGVARTAVRAAQSQLLRRQRQREQLARLREGLGSEVLELPYLFCADLGLAELERLADALEDGLNRPAALPGGRAAGTDRR